MKNSYATVRMQEMGYGKKTGDYVILRVVLTVSQSREKQQQTERGRGLMFKLK